MNRCLLIFILMLTLFGCQREVSVFEKGSFPDRLSEWNIVFVQNHTLVLNEDVVAYDLNTPLFTDYAHKLRTIWTPPGKHGTYSKNTDIELPIGTIVTKTFFYPREGEQLLQTSDESRDFNSTGLDLTNVQLIETRLMVRLEAGWQGLAYVWNERQDEAFLEIAGESISLNLSSSEGGRDVQYIVPDFNQCQGCHVENLNTKEMRLIGVKVRHINKAYSQLNPSDSQIQHMIDVGILEDQPSALLTSLPANFDWKMAHSNPSELNHKARSYLDINCGHCHNPKGAGDTSGLFLNIGENERLKLGYCKPPVAAGQGTGGRLVGILPGDASGSILTYRMQSLDLGAMMPELGRSTVHLEGVQLISEWIDGMEEGC